MAGLLSSLGQKLGGLLGSPEMEKALWLTAASGGDPKRAAYIREQKAIDEEAEQQRIFREMQMQQTELALQRQQEEEARRRIGNVTMQHYAENPNAIAFGGPGATYQQQLAGLLSRGVDPQIATGLIGQSTELPADARLYEWAKGDPARMAFVQRSNQTQLPSNIQEWQQFQQMTPEQQAQYLQMKRAGSMVDIGGVPNYVPPGSTAPQPLTTPDVVADRRRQQAAAAAEGTETGKATATAQIDLPKVESNAGYMVRLLDELKAHPGKAYAVGATSVAPILPGTPAAGFMSRLEQVKGEQFLQAYQQLKGSGTITEIEGIKAEQAIARMNRAQSEAEFDTAVDDFKGAILRGVQGARAKAGAGYPKITGPSQAQGGPIRKVYNPNTGMLE